MDMPCERFHVLWLRSVTDTKDDKGNVKEKAYQKRYRLIRQAIDILKPDAVFIDGIRDIIGNFNDNEESSALVTDLMALAEQRQICIWNTLHMNPRMKNDDESKMRGHLGTELGNKVTDTLVCIKHKNDKTGEVYFTVKQDDARNKDMEDWEFVVTGAAGARCPSDEGRSQRDRHHRIEEPAVTHRSRRHIQTLSVDIQWSNMD